MIKWFSSRAMPNLPVINNTQGELVSMLTALLVNGVNTKSVATVSYADGVCTLEVGANHGFVLHGVVDVQNSSQAVLNGSEFSVSALTPTTISFEVATPVTNEVGLTVRYAPLGYTSHFESQGRACYKSKNPKHTSYLRVDDVKFSGTDVNAAKFAGVEICEDMSDFNTAVGAQSPFEPNYPLQNRQTISGRSNGWFKWYYSATALSFTETDRVSPSGKKDYMLIGDDSGFYLVLYPDGSSPVMYGMYQNDSNTHLLANNGYDNSQPYNTRNVLDSGGYAYCICSLYGFQGMPTDNREYVTPIFPFTSANISTSFNQAFLKKIAMKNVFFNVAYGTLPNVLLSDTRVFNNGDILEGEGKKYLVFSYSRAALFFEVG